MKEIDFTEIQISPFRTKGGLVAFASVVINNQFYVGNIAIYTSPTTNLGYRLVFPTKKLNNGKHVECFYPINRETERLVTVVLVRSYTHLMESLYHAEEKQDVDKLKMS